MNTPFLHAKQDNISVKCVQARLWTTKIFSQNDLTFMFLQKVKVKSDHLQSISISLWLFGKHENHFHFEKIFWTVLTELITLLTHIAEVISLWMTNNSNNIIHKDITSAIEWQQYYTVYTMCIHSSWTLHIFADVRSV